MPKPLENYLNLRQRPFQLSLLLNRTNSFTEVFHAHQGIELLYIHEGEGHAVFERQRVELRPGTLVCFRPFQLHRVHIDVGPERPYVRSMLLFEPAALLPYVQPFPALAGFLYRLWKDPLAAQQALSGLASSETELLFEACRARLAELRPDAPAEDYALLLVSLLHAIKTRFAAAQRRPATAVETLPDAVVRSIRRLDERFAEPFVLAELAAHVHLSPSHLSYLFHKETGNTLTEYLHARRMKEACLLLLTTSLTVRDIGLQVGLSNFSYFCQSFKETIGVSPAKYRKGVHSGV
jgi:AraC-like DNA-binding protein